MSSSGETYVEEAEGVGVSEAIRRILVAPALAIAGGIAGVIATGFDQVGEVIGALGDVREFLTQLVADGPIVILEAGASITAGELPEFGVLAFVVGTGVIAGSWVLWTTIDPEIPLLDSLLPWR